MDTACKPYQAFSAAFLFDAAHIRPVTAPKLILAENLLPLSSSTDFSSATLVDVARHRVNEAQTFHRPNFCMSTRPTGREGVVAQTTEEEASTSTPVEEQPAAQGEARRLTSRSPHPQHLWYIVAVNDSRLGGGALGVTVQVTVLPPWRRTSGPAAGSTSEEEAQKGRAMGRGRCG